MYIVLVYDIANKKKSNASKVRKLVEQYLARVQYSVFEGEITEANYLKLTTKLKDSVKKEIDSIVIYELNTLKYTNRVIIGQDKLNSLFI